MNILDLIGLVGLSVLVVTGRLLNPVRDWMLSFSHPANPLKLTGQLLSSSMATGFWVGFIWAISRGWAFGAFVSGGLVAILAHVTEELLVILGSESIKRAKGVMRRPSAPEPVRRHDVIPTEAEVDMAMEDT